MGFLSTLKQLLTMSTTTKTMNTSDIIGYANAKDCMLSLPPPNVQSGPITLEPKEPLTNRQGLLTGYQEGLEPYVKSGLLRWIMKDDKVFADWDKRQAERNRPKVRPTQEPKVAVQAEPPHVNISSQNGIQVEEAQEARVVSKEEAETIVERKKRGRPSTVESKIVERDGKFYVNEHEFDTKAAAIGFLKFS